MLPCFDLQAPLTLTFRLTIIAVFPVFPQLKEFAFPQNSQTILWSRAEPEEPELRGGLGEEPRPSISMTTFGKLFSLLRGHECLCQRFLVSTSKAPQHHHPPPPIPPGLPALWLWRQTTLECVCVLFLVLFTSWLFQRKVCLCSQIPFGRSLVSWCHYGVI